MIRKLNALWQNFEAIVSQASACICKQNTKWKSLTFNMQFEFTALLGANHDFTSLKQELEQRIINNYT